jgi:DNA-binding transcriptional ArsR family regulator
MIMSTSIIEKDRCETRCIHLDTVNSAKDAALDEEETINLASFFKTFADPNRLKILMALEKHEMCVCDIASFLDISESAVSHQLRYLRNTRLVKNRREGTVLYYRLVDEHVHEIILTGLEHVRE